MKALTFNKYEYGMNYKKFTSLSSTVYCQKKLVKTELRLMYCSTVSQTFLQLVNYARECNLS